MLDLIKSGKLAFASATALSLGPKRREEFNRDVALYREKVDPAPAGDQQPPGADPPPRRDRDERDDRGRHLRQRQLDPCERHPIMNGIGGSGDFARNAYISIFMTPSTAKNGAISCIVPMVTHVDHTEHDVQVIVTEQGLADLRGLSPKQRAEVIIANCAHPAYRPALEDYFERALA